MLISKVLLINPPTKEGSVKYIREGRCTQQSDIWSFVYPPYSLVSTATYLRSKGFDVEVKDGMLSLEQWEESLTDFSNKYDVAIVNIGSASFVNDIEFVQRLKKICSKIITIVIGTHTASNPDYFLEKYSFIDYIIMGEPEFSSLRLLTSLNAGLVPEKKISDLTGNLDELPHPDWELIDMNDYRNPLNGKKVFMILPQRGCSWSCSYCTAPQYYGNKFRYRSIAHIDEELNLLQSNYSDFEVLFWSDTFTVNKQFVHNVAALMKEKSIKWMANARLDTLNKELIEVMANSGCYILTVGIESGSQYVLDRNKKGLRVDTIKKKLSEINNEKISIIGHFILGLPGESIESLIETEKMIKNLNIDYAQFYYATPFPGTEVHSLYFKNDEGLDRDFQQGQLEFELSEVSSKDLSKFRGRFIRSILLRKKTLYFFIKNVKFVSLKVLFRNFKSCMNWLRA